MACGVWKLSIIQTLCYQIIAHDDMLKVSIFRRRLKGNGCLSPQDSESGDESSSTALTAKAVQGATEEVSAPLRRNNLTVSPLTL